MPLARELAGARELWALNDVSFDVDHGTVLGVIGSNGAGKTTTLRLLLDLIRPTRGEARLFGLPPGELAARARVGYLAGDLVLDARLTGRQMLRYLASLRPSGPALRGSGKEEETRERLGLSSADLDRRIRGYSRGMRQKLGLLAALQHDPELLVLDEPTSALDPLVREVVFDLIAEAARAGRTVLHSSHVLSEVERTCTRVAILRAGRLVRLERIEEVRRSTVRRMVVRFVDEVNPAELALPGIEVLVREGRSFVLRVAGALDPLLGVLARHAVEHLAFPEPSLEEAFVEHYRKGGGSPS